MEQPYYIAQRAIADLKAAVYMILHSSPKEGLTNAQIGRTLGIYTGHVGHEGHIPRVLLSLMESEDVVKQDGSTRKWSIKVHKEEEQG